MTPASMEEAFSATNLPENVSTFDLQWYKSCMAMMFLPFLFAHIKFVKYLYHVPSFVPKPPPFYLPLMCIYCEHKRKLETGEAWE